MPIYTYDCLQNQVFPQLRTPKFSSLKLSDVLRKQAEEYDVGIWERDQDLIQLRHLATSTFKETYRQGLENYLSGDWEKAREYFIKADSLMINSDSSGDGPSKTLIAYMRKRDFQCPHDWKGFRPLTSK